MKTLFFIFTLIWGNLAIANHPPKPAKYIGQYQPQKGYIVRIGSYHEIYNARRTLKKLQNKKYSTYTYIKKQRDKNDKILYSVQTLTLPLRQEAEEVFDDIMKNTEYLPLLVEL